MVEMKPHLWSWAITGLTEQFGKQPWAAGQTIRKNGILVQLPFPLKF